MKTILPHLPFLFLLIGCSKPATSDSFDYRHDWEMHVPTLIDGQKAPTLDGTGIKWRAEGDAARLAPLIALTAADWNKHLSCGLNPAEAKQKEKPNIIWRCVAEHVSNEHVTRNPTCGIGNDLNQEAMIVLINQELCDSPSTGMLRHAWGHALGLEESYRYYLTIMDGHQVHFPRSAGFSPMETDGFRAWAHALGAPGCGDKELPWSWKQYPDMYQSYPAEDAFQSSKIDD